LAHNWGLGGLAFGDQYSFYLASFAILLAALVMIGYYDFSRLIIPNWINGLLLLFGLFFSARTGFSLFVFASFGAAGVALLFYCLACFYERVRGRSGLGMGDIKLIATTSVWVGIVGLPWVLLIASNAALVHAVVQNAMKGNVQGATRIPFGPYIALGLFLVWYFQNTEVLSVL
jgi:leader peptidase (prepilin peptidase) / N-methyltransferase